MIRSKYILAFLLVLFHSPGLASSEWNKARISEILPEGTVLFGKNEVAELVGIDYKSFHTEDSCFRRIILKELRKAWIDQDIQWRWEAEKVLIKNTKLGNMSEYLLQKGMARLNEKGLSSYYKEKFRTATTKAKTESLGIWRGCSKEHAKRKIRLIREKQYFMDQHEGFLAPVSTGKVIKVIEGNLIELENGIRAKLIGVSIPGNEGNIEDCFRDQSRKFLSNLLVGRTVILRADRVDFDNKGTLLRYIYLPSREKKSRRTPRKPIPHRIRICKESLAR